MKMVFRWWPNGDDTVQLEQIRQIPGVSGVATMFSDIPAGEVWPKETILALKDQVNKAGLEMEVIESVNVHEDIKKGLATRDEYISNYITTMKNLHEAGIKCICYNLMPVMDWFRSRLEYPLSDGSFAMAYEHSVAQNLSMEKIIHSMMDGSQDMTLPGWEPERFPAMAPLRNISRTSVISWMPLCRMPKNMIWISVCIRTIRRGRFSVFRR